MAITRRSAIQGAASVAALAAAPVPMARAVLLTLSPTVAAQPSVSVASTMAALWIESWPRDPARRAAGDKVFQAWGDLERQLLTGHGYACEAQRPNDPPNFRQYRVFKRLWRKLPLERQAATVLKAVAARLAPGPEVEYAAAYLLVALGDAPGHWFEDKLRWALRLLRNITPG